MERPTLQQLAYFVALAEQGHFGRAAAACYVSQPALSAQIRELEKRLGATLVERRPRGVLLTATGEVVLERAREVLRAADDIVESARLGDAGPLRLGIIPTIAPYLLPRILPSVRTVFPSAELGLREVRTAELLTDLRRGDLDLGVFALPVDGIGDLVVEPLVDDPFLVATSTDHPLSTSTTPLPLGALADQPVLLLEEGHCLRSQALEVCDLHVVPTRTVHGTSLTTLVQLVAAGQGVTLLPASAASVESRAGQGLAVRALEEPAPSRTIALVWRGTSPRAARYGELASRLRAELTDVPSADSAA